MSLDVFDFNDKVSMHCIHAMAWGIDVIFQRYHLRIKPQNVEIYSCFYACVYCVEEKFKIKA